jgi:hypothetical protein
VTEPVPTGSTPSRGLYPYGGGQDSGSNLADILERVLDKGIVIVGDIKINLLDIELLTIKLRLLVASVDKAKEIGIDWWEHDPALSSRADRHGADHRTGLEEQNERLRAEVKELRRRVERAESESGRELPPRAAGGGRRTREAERERTGKTEAGGRKEPRRPRRTTREGDDDEDRGREP